MVDITNFVFNKIKPAVLALYSNANVTKTYQNTETAFPCVTFLDIDNPEISHTLSYTNRQSNPSWQIDIYMTGGTKETVSKKIASAIASIMEDELHMRRVSARPTVNAADTTIYRYTMIYRCNLDEDTQRIYS